MCSNSSKGPMEKRKSEDVVNAGGAEDGRQRDVIVNRERRFLQYADHAFDANHEKNDQSYRNEDRSMPMRKKLKVHPDINEETDEQDDCVEKDASSTMSSNSTQHASKHATSSSHYKASDDRTNKGSGSSKLSLIANLINSRGKEDYLERKNNNQEFEEDQREPSAAPKMEYEEHKQNENSTSYHRVEKNSLDPNHDSKMMRYEDNDETARNKLNSTHHGRTNSGNIKTPTEGLNQVPTSMYKSSASQRHSSQSTHGSSSKKTSYRFPVKLMRVLSCGKYNDVISWTPDGKAFVVHDQTALVEKVLPLNDFKGVKYSSFTRKLHRWGFVKILRGGGDSSHRSAYFHKHFQRGNFALCHEMRCSGKGDDDEVLHQYGGDIYDHIDGNVVSYSANSGQQHVQESPHSSFKGGNMAGGTQNKYSGGIPQVSDTGTSVQTRSLDDTLKILQAERELLMIEHQRKLLREEEERRMMFATTSPYGIAGLNYLNSLRHTNPADSLLGGYPSASAIPNGFMGPSANLHGVTGSLLDAPSSSALHSLSDAGRGPSMLPSSGAMIPRTTQEELLLASAARRGDLSSMIGEGGMLTDRGASLLPGHAGAPLSIHQTTSTSIVRDALNPSSYLLDSHARSALPPGAPSMPGDYSREFANSVSRRGMFLEGHRGIVQESKLRENVNVEIAKMKNQSNGNLMRALEMKNDREGEENKSHGSYENVE